MRWLLTLSLCAICAISPAYEISFGQGGDNGESPFHYVPVAHGKWAISALGKDYARFPGQETNVVALNNFNGLGPALFSFSESGRLEKFFRHSDDSDAQNSDFRLLTRRTLAGFGKAESLWRKRGDSDGKSGKWWKGGSRLKLWYFNPNGAGLLFAEFAVLFFAIALFVVRKRLARAILLISFAGAFGLMLATGSRGGLVALAAALGYLVVAFSWGAWKWRGVCAVLAISIAVATAIRLGVLGERYGRDLFETSEGNIQRIKAWQAAPAMMAAAPRGWSDLCGRDYGNWFQDMDDRHPLTYLVNTHLTWMVAKGRFFSYAYCTGWALLFALLWSWRGGRLKPAVLSMWILFFGANWFSTLGFFKSLWILPATMTAVAIPWLVRDLKLHRRRAVVALAVALATGISTVFSAVRYGEARLSRQNIAVRREGKVTFVGSGDPVTYLVPDYWALSHFVNGSVGRDVREWCEKNRGRGTLAIADSVDDLPATAQRLVLSGVASGDFRRIMKDGGRWKNFCKAESMVLLSPVVSSNAFGDRFLEKNNIEVYTGEFLAELTESGESAHVHKVPGCELYVTNWVDIAFNKAKK